MAKLTDLFSDSMNLATAIAWQDADEKWLFCDNIIQNSDTNLSYDPDLRDRQLNRYVNFLEARFEEMIAEAHSWDRDDYAPEEMPDVDPAEYRGADYGDDEPTT